MVHRRRFLSGLATTGTITVAGCSNEEGDPTGSTGSEQTSDEVQAKKNQLGRIQEKLNLN